MADYTARPNDGGGPLAPYTRAEDFGLSAALAPLQKKLEERRRQANVTKSMRLVGDASLDIAKKVQALKDGVSGDGAGFADGLEAQWDTLTQPYLDGAPGDMRDYVEQRMLGLKTSFLTDAVDFETKTATAAHFRNISETLGVTANAIRSDGKLFQSAIGDLQAMVAAAGLPQELALRLQDETEQNYAIAYAQGLGDRDPYTGRRLLHSGELDAYLEPGKKDALLGNFDVEIRRRESEARAEATAARLHTEMLKKIEGVTVAQEIKADVASIAETGVGLKGLTAERIAATLGPEDAVKWAYGREAAMKVREATAGLPAMPDAQIRTTIEKLRPVAGAADFDDQAAAFAKAEEKGKRIIAERLADPAAAVDGMVRVEGEAPRAAARLAAQEALGIPDWQQAPLTKTEIADLLEPIKAAAATGGNAPEALSAMTQEVQRRFGPELAPAVVSQVLREKGLDADNAAFGAALLGKLRLGRPATWYDLQTGRMLDETSASAIAVDPRAATITPDQGDMQGTAPTGFGQSDLDVLRPLRPPQEALDMLLADPANQAGNFDAIFGPGQAAYYIGRSHGEAQPRRSP